MHSNEIQTKEDCFENVENIGDFYKFVFRAPSCDNILNSSKRLDI